MHFLYVFISCKKFKKKGFEKTYMNHRNYIYNGLYSINVCFWISGLSASDPERKKKLTFSGESDSAFFCRYNSYVVNYNL